MLTRVDVLSSKILMISDDFETAQVWLYILNQRGIGTVLITPSDDDTTERRSEYAHDLIMIDTNSLQMDVSRLIRRLRTESSVPILVLVLKDYESTTLDLYDSGADEVIVKPISARLFMAKIKAWMRRSWTVPASTLTSFQVGDLCLDPAQRQLVLKTGKVVKLTSLEFSLVHLLMNQPNQVLESTLIIDRMWGRDGDGDNALLKNVVYRLRRKIEPDPSSPRYVLSITGEGYMLAAPSE